MNRFPRAVKIVALLVAAVLAGFAGDRTTAEFSSTTANSANAFSAAASFGAATASGVVVRSTAVSTSYTASVLADAPLAYWRLGEAIGNNTAADASGNGRVGTYPSSSGTVRGTPGAVGDGNTAVSFGTFSIEVPHFTADRLNGSFTVEAWVRVQNLNASGSAPRSLVGKGTQTNVDGWRVDFGNNGALAFKRNLVTVSSAPGALAGGTYHHAVATYDGTTLRWYVDGLLGTTTAVVFPAGAGTGNVVLGGAASTGETISLDEPALYGTALSAAQVNARYRAGRALSADPCEQYRVYTNITDGGSAVTGVSSATADLSAVTAGLTAVPLTAGSYTVGGVAYSYRSAPLRVGVAAGSYDFGVSWVDGSGSHTQAGLTTTVGAPIPITPYWFGGFEGMTSSADTFIETSGASGVTSGAHSGANARMMSKGTTGSVYVGLGGLTPTSALSLAVRFPSALPSADVTSLVMFNTSTTPLYLGYQSATQRLTLRWGSNTAAVATGAMAAGTWYVLDFRVDVSADPNTASWRIDGNDEGAVSLAGAAQTVTTLRVGSALAGDIFPTFAFDDIVHSRSLFDYPIGAVRVLGARPDGVGTHSIPANFQHEDGSAISASTFSRLADSNMTTSTQFVQQVTASATSYLEFTVGNTSEVCVRGVQALVGHHKAAAQANNMKTSVFSGTTERVVYSGDSTGNFAPTLKTANVAPVTTPWSVAEFNALVYRIGYSTDANPIPYWDSLLLEYITSG